MLVKRVGKNIETLPKIKYFPNLWEENFQSLNIRSHFLLLPHISDQIYTSKESKKNFTHRWVTPAPGVITHLYKQALQRLASKALTEAKAVVIAEGIISLSGSL